MYGTPHRPTIFLVSIPIKSNNPDFVVAIAPLSVSLAAEQYDI
jgi:hypothetical protein